MDTFQLHFSIKSTHTHTKKEINYGSTYHSTDTCTYHRTPILEAIIYFSINIQMYFLYRKGLLSMWLPPKSNLELEYGLEMARIILSFILLILAVVPAWSLYFHIGETEKKCFIEEIPDETMVIGNYKIQIFDKNKNDFLPSSPGIGMHVEVRDPEDKMILSKMYSSSGRFTFTSHTPGEHTLCLYSNSTKWSMFGASKLRIHLDIEVGEHANDYKEIAEKDKLTELQLRVRQLLDQVEQVKKEQNYQRYREERFRTTSESTNQRVLWWSIAQTVILLVTGFWQMRHLKGFFEAKKLV